MIVRNFQAEALAYASLRGAGAEEALSLSPGTNQSRSPMYYGLVNRSSKRLQGQAVRTEQSFSMRGGELPRGGPYGHGLWGRAPIVG